jgi:hypothetical protein
VNEEKTQPQDTPNRDDRKIEIIDRLFRLIQEDGCIAMTAEGGANRYVGLYFTSHLFAEYDMYNSCANMMQVIQSPQQGEYSWKFITRPSLPHYVLLLLVIIQVVSYSPIGNLVRSVCHAYHICLFLCSYLFYIHYSIIACDVPNGEDHFLLLILFLVNLYAHPFDIFF